MHSRRYLALGAIAALSAIGLCLPVAASAEKVVKEYPPAEQERTFSSPDHGWTSEERYSGLCLQGVTCPHVVNGYVADDGAGGQGDGFLRTEMGSLTGVASTTGGILESAPFEYHGIGGVQPDKIEFGLSVRADLEEFLAIGENSTTFAVELADLNAGGGKDVRVIAGEQLEPTDGWTAVPTVEVEPNALTLGHRYKVVIATRFKTDAVVGPGGTVDYDNVVVRATGDDEQRGAGGDDAVLKGNRLFLELRCLRETHQGKCTIKAVAYERQGGPRMTFPITRKVDADRGKVITMRVRPRFVDDLAAADRVLMKLRHLEGGKRSDVRKTTWQEFNLIHKEAKG